MNQFYKINLIFVALLTLGVTSFAQTLPVGLLENIEDNFRNQQLLGNDTSKSSFMIRPINITSHAALSLDKGLSFTLFRRKMSALTNDGEGIYLLPLTWQQQFNGHHPYGMNDGSMIRSRGYQTQLAAGLYAKIGPLSIQLRPEYVYAENKEFRELQNAPNMSYFRTDVFLSNYYNKIDLPDRFGSRPYSRLNWGQSSARLTFDPVSVGISSENLWWGPGVRNSLVMSNNASGFKHLTLNTSRPINTPIGSFETQLIAGRLDHSGTPLVNNPLVIQKPDDWRLITGIVFTYQPKWLTQLYLGFDKTSTSYNMDRGESMPGTKGNYGSLFARWLMPESHSEAYLQYGTDKHPFNLTDSTTLNRTSSAYVVGFRKLLPLKASNEYIQVGIELTSVEASRGGLDTYQPSWYLNSSTGDGYTNNGQILGAGIGTGSSMQSLQISWVKGLRRLGIQFERLVNNNDLFYEAVKEIRLHWVDLAIGGKFDWTYKNIILNSQVTYIRSLNYQYEFQPDNGGKYWQWDKQDANNLHLKIGLMYCF
jgi:hypothetical protein